MPNSNVSKTFWKNVYKTLIDQNMTLVDLANEAGLSHQSMLVSKQVGSSLRVGTVIRVSDILGVTPSYLLGTDYVNRKGSDPETLLEGDLEKAIQSMPTEALRLIDPCLSSKNQYSLVKIAKALKENN
ncbi:MAG: hypothetical protein MSS69_03955 [Spirochaetales bacterium]|nr:hypothetical protein [Spirochaetales bacterium]